MSSRSFARRIFPVVTPTLAVAAIFSLFPVIAASQQVYTGPAIAQQCFSSPDPDVRIRYCTEAINSDILDLVGVATQGGRGGLQVMRHDVFSDNVLAEAYYDRATAYVAKNDYNRAIEDFNQVIRMEPESPAAFGNRGNAYAAKGNFDQAIQDYTQAIHLAPFSAAAFINRGVAYDTLGQHDRALRDYSQAIHVDSKSAVAYNDRGSAFNDAHDYERALKDFDQAIEIDPKYVQAYRNRAHTYQIKGDIQRAIQDCRHILQIDPHNAAAQDELHELQTAK